MPVARVLAALLLAAAVGAGTLGGCAGQTTPSGGATSTTPAQEPGQEPAGPDETRRPQPEPEPEPEPTTAADVRDRRSADLRLEGLTVHYVDGITAATREHSRDGQRWTITRDPEHPDHRVALIAAPEGTAFQLLSDGSVVLPPEPGVTDGIGLAPPAAGTSALLAPDLLEIRARASAPGEPVELWFGLHAVEEATWGEAEGGRSLAVVPTPWARAAGMAGAELAWWHIEWLAGDEATPGMRDQLVCHALGAPDKASWNLEPWRPAVGLTLTLLAECNPT